MLCIVVVCSNQARAHPNEVVEPSKDDGQLQPVAVFAEG